MLPVNQVFRVGELRKRLLWSGTKQALWIDIDLDAALPEPISAAVAPVSIPVQQAPQVQVAAAPVVEVAAEPKPALKSDVVTVTLKPGEASGIKLEMLDKATVSYEWTTNGVPVNHDTHGEPYNGAKGYFHS